MLNQFTAKLTRTRIRAEIVDSSQNLNKQQIKGKCRRQTCSTDFLVGADVARLVHVRPAAIHLVYCVRTARSDCRYTTTLRRQRNMAAARVRTSPCPVETGPCVCVSSCESFVAERELPMAFFFQRKMPQRWKESGQHQSGGIPPFQCYFVVQGASRMINQIF